MSRALFIGDSHTCGYWSHPTKEGPGSYTYWNDNNYAEVYSEINNKPVAIYAMAGVTNRSYTDWMRSMFNTYNDIDEVFLCMAPFNRFTLGFDSELTDDIIPVDHFIAKMETNNGIIDRYCDHTIVGESVQLYNKPTFEDYDKFPGFDFDASTTGLKTPDLRKHTFMQIKLFFDLNSFIEKRDFLLNVFTWDRMCDENGAKLYLFNMTERLKYPTSFNYYGKLPNTVVANKTVEGYLSSKHIDHTKFFIEDKEHYNREYHTMIAEKYIPWLKNQ
jgi:hypothetical protein